MPGLKYILLLSSFRLLRWNLPETLTARINGSRWSVWWCKFWAFSAFKMQFCHYFFLFFLPLKSYFITLETILANGVWVVTTHWWNVEYFWSLDVNFYFSYFSKVFVAHLLLRVCINFCGSSWFKKIIC